MKTIVQLILESNISLFDTAMGVTILWAVMYGLPHYLYQLRANTMSEHASKAIEIIRELVIHIHDLCASYVHDDIKEDALLKTLALLFQQLEGHLRLLSRDFDMHHAISGVKKRLDKTLNNLKYGPTVAARDYLRYEFGDDFERKVREPKIPVHFLQKMESTLQQIVAAPLARQVQWRTLIIFSVATLCCHVIRVLWTPLLLRLM